MTPAPLPAGPALPGSVRVEVEGGKPTNPMGRAEISSADFRQAIVHTIRRDGIFRNVNDAGSAGFQLDVLILAINFPGFSADYPVDLSAQWTLTRTSDRRIVFENLIRGHYTARLTESLIGVERVRKGMAGAARDNIRQGLEGIRRLSL